MTIFADTSKLEKYHKLMGENSQQAERIRDNDNDKNEKEND